MRHHWKLAVAAAATLFLLWNLRTGQTPNALYPILPPKTKLEISTLEAMPGTAVSGRVVWTGPRPAVPPLRRPFSRYFQSPDSRTPNPLAPEISADNGLANVFVILDGPYLDAGRWPHAAVRVEYADYDCAVVQGGRRSRFGIVRQGDEAEFVAKDAQGHAARARGAEFFTMMLPTPDKPLRKPLRNSGMTEITSGSWYYWAQARLWVSPHRFCTLTDADGRFTLKDVPPGNYTLSAVRANWTVARLDIDTEFPVPVRATFGPAVTKTQRITVGKEPGAPVTFEMSADLFAIGRGK